MMNYKKQIVVLLLTCLGSISLRAQENINRPNHDMLPAYFGITIGYNNSNLQTTRSPAFLAQNTFNRIEPHSSSGLELGFVGTVRLSNRFELRTLPKLILGGSKSLSYYYTDDYLNNNAGKVSPENIKLPANIFSIPLQLKLNADRIKNFRVYMFAGLKYDINISANANEYKQARQLGQNPPPLFRKADFGYEGGIGFNIYMPFTVMSPEIKIGNTFGNSHVRDASNPYSTVLNQFRTQMIVFSLNFEQ